MRFDTLTVFAFGLLLVGCSLAQKEDSPTTFRVIQGKKEQPLQYSRWEDCMRGVQILMRRNGALTLARAFGFDTLDISVCKRQKVWVVGERKGIKFTVLYVQRRGYRVLTAKEIKRYITEYATSPIFLSTSVHETMLPTMLKKRLVVVNAFKLSPPLPNKLYIARIPIEFKGAPYWLLLGAEGIYPSRKFIRRVVENFLQRSVDGKIVKVLDLR